MPDAEGGQRVDDRVLHGRRRADRAGLPDALGPQRVVAGRRLAVGQLEAGHLGGRHERVVGEGRGQRVAVRIEDHLLQERLRRALGDAAVPLSLGQQRVDDGARVVDGHHPPQHRLAGLGVHLDDRHVRPEREGGALGPEHGPDEQPLPLGQSGQRDRDVRIPGHRERAAGEVEDQVGGVGFQLAGGTLPGYVEQLAGGLLDGRAALLQAARAAGAAALGDQVGVAPPHRDLVDRDAELVAGQHGPYRDVTLAVRGRPGQDGGAAVGMDLDRGVLPRPALLRARAGDLHVAGQADAELGHVAGGAPLGLLLPQVGVSGRVQRPGQRGRVVAAVVHGAERGRVRFGEGGQQVHRAHLGRVPADLGREQVHGPLHRGGGLGAAGAAVGADRRGVRHHRFGHRLGPGEGVGPGRHQDGQRGQERAEPRVRPGVLQDLQAVGGHRPVPAAADRDRLALGPAVRHPDQVLVPGLGPARRAAEPPGHPAHHRVLRVGAELGAERAAHVRGDDPDRRLVDAEQAGQAGAGALRALARDPRRQPAAGIPGGRRRPGLHRGRRHPLVEDRPGDDHLAAVEQVGPQRGRVAEGGGHVAAHGGEQHGRFRAARLGHVDHRGQQVVVDIHQVRGILALVAALGHDHGHRLADVPDHLPGQQRLAHLRVDHAAHGRGQVRQVQVRGGERGDHARRRQRAADVNRGDPRVRDRGPDEMDVTGTRQAQVIRVDPAGGQESGILCPQNPGTQYAHVVDHACQSADRSKPPDPSGR